MKLKRMIASVLALLLVVSLLPMTALATEVDNNPKGTTVPEIASDETMHQNRGTVTTNSGTLDDNRGTVNTNDGTVICNLGLVETNNKNVNVNSQSVTTNRGAVITNGTKGTLTTNEKDVTYNKGNVVTNAATGTVVNNWGNITTNNGTVNTNKTIKDKDGVEFKGVIETNNGTVISNNAGGTVENNAKNGKIETNNGKITTNNGTVGSQYKLNEAIEEAKGESVNPSGSVDITKEVADAAAEKMQDQKSGNFGTITDNKGKICYNGTDGFIETNDGDVNLNNGKVETNKKFVVLNTGTVEINNGYVGLNNGTVETNNWAMQQNNGTVETNNQYVKQNTGTVETNRGGVNLNNGTVETNKEMVDRNNGTVVTNAIDGFVGNGFNKESAEYGLKDSKENEASPEKGGVVEKNFGTVYDYTKPDGEDGLTIYYGLSWGENTDHLNLIDGEVVEGTEKNLDEIAKGVNNSGYRMTGYTAYYRKGGKDIEITEGTNCYTMNAPTWLKILWEKIVTAVESNEPEAKKTSTPTTLSADQVKVGAYVRQGNLLFRIIEVNDDSIRVVIVGKLSEQALADMLGFLKQHLSDAQIAKINGEPKLLEQELVTYFIGGRNEHISFYAARDLFA